MIDPYCSIVPKAACRSVESVVMLIAEVAARLLDVIVRGEFTATLTDADCPAADNALLMAVCKSETKSVRDRPPDV